MSAFSQLATPTAGFRTRYLMMEVAAALAATAPPARAYLDKALRSDASPHVRARAAQVVGRVDLFQQSLVAALSDRGVRVRQHAAQTLAKPEGSFATAALVGRLEQDRWPLVRAAAARAIGTHGPNEAADRALEEALADPSPEVRRPVVLALGKRQALGAAGSVRDRLDDKKEIPAVRAAAAVSLGFMCDRGSLDVLTDYALELTKRHASKSERVIGRGALAALGWMHPKDLEERLAPLSGDKVLSTYRAAAAVALGGKSRCGGAGGPEVAIAR